MIRGYNEIDYERLAKKAIEKNIGYFMRKLSRDSDAQTEIITIKRGSGITYHKTKKKWIAQKNINGKIKTIGSFTAPEEALKAYQNFIDKFSNEMIAA